MDHVALRALVVSIKGTGAKTCLPVVKYTVFAQTITLETGEFFCPKYPSWCAF